MPLNEQLIISTIEIAKEAGEAISQIYKSDFDYQIITERLKILTPEIPILSEENCNIPFKVRSQWADYWLIDPLDGTKEFINNNGEFTVNIALVKNNTPILGIIHIPISHETYWGSKNKGSFYLNANDDEVNISVSNNHQNPIRIVASRSHPSEMLNYVLEKIINYEIIKIGSSIKFCHIASGQADCYPRFGPTSEWDTAAGEAIVRYAGGHMVTLNGNLMQYNAKKDYLNPNFIVSSDKIISESFLSLMSWAAWDTVSSWGRGMVVPQTFDCW